jgi:subtilisin-like proprotein convertase family protein
LAIKIKEMKKKLLISIFALLLLANGYAQNPLWRTTSIEKLSNLPLTNRESFPLEYQLFSLDFAAMKSQLLSAPSRDSNNGIASSVIIQFPNSDGQLENFRVYEASVMHPDLAERYLDIQSYVGQGIEDPTASISLSTTIFGLHAMVLSGNRPTIYIDTYTQDLSNYIVYEKRQLRTSIERACLVQDEFETQVQQGLRNTETTAASDGLFRTYRLAMACTIEYAAYHVTAAGLGAGTLAQKKAAVLAAMVVSMTRINGVYEKDMSLKMQLVANNDLVIFVDSDNFSNDSASALINESQSVIDANIGFSNYDIGHTVSTGGGGLAQSPSVCTSSKARGITGSPAPVGDAFDIDFVAHEIGHQFGASHTFNGIGGNCTTGTRADTYAVEPGSGTTIMAYAGICSGVDVQPNSDDHFHAVSIAQMVSHVTGAGACSVNVSNGNTPPVVNAGLDYIIPNGTAFILKGAATDANNDSLTYCWEQTNNTISTQPPASSATVGPNFRSFTPSVSPNRYMPAFSNVLAGNLAPTWQVVPTVARTMNFALTVRDNRTPNGGQTNRDDVTVTFASVGPFKLTNPSVQNASWTQGSSQTITWDVAGTTANGINTANVNILLSTDGGATFGTVLATNTTNDGTHTITVPNIAAPYCRIMIEAVGNIYYAISKSFSIGYLVSTTTTCNTYTASPGTAIAAQNPLAWQILGSVNVPTNVVISDLNLAVNITHPKINDLYIGLLKPGATTVGEIRVVYQQGCSTLVSSNMITNFDDSGVNLSCGGIAGNNTYKPLNTLDIFNGQSSLGDWRLVIADVATANNGTLNSFAVNICSTTTTETLATENFGLSDFVLYPNPNKGNFTIQFNSASSSDVSIVINDMRGRQIFNKAYQNTGLFSQNLQLDSVQAGVYLVTVQDGDKREVKRIIIE